MKWDAFFVNEWISIRSVIRPRNWKKLKYLLQNPDSKLQQQQQNENMEKYARRQQFYQESTHKSGVIKFHGHVSHNGSLSTCPPCCLLFQTLLSTEKGTALSSEY